jgi:glycosyltransferase involved in cell wall biosynthesis
MKLIATIPVRNEDWILERNLQTLSHFCDVIIVADQQSTDMTRQICRRYDKVVIIPNTSPLLDVELSGSRQLMLNAARDHDGKNIVLAVDADEIVTATVLGSAAWQNALDALQPGRSLLLQWITLWRDPGRYRNDASVWSNNWKQFVFRDDRQTDFSRFQMHGPRMPLPFTQEAVRLDEVKVLHYQFVTWHRMLSKQRYYRVLERITSLDKSAVEINDVYVITRDERNMVLQNVPAEWVAPWQERGIDLEHFAEAPLYWYDVEVLRSFKQYGVQCFAALDIWDVDWEQKRQLALAQDQDEMPDEPINDPRSWSLCRYDAYLRENYHAPRLVYYALRVPLGRRLLGWPTWMGSREG